MGLAFIMLEWHAWIVIVSNVCFGIDDWMSCARPPRLRGVWIFLHTRLWLRVSVWVCFWRLLVVAVVLLCFHWRLFSLVFFSLFYRHSSVWSIERWTCWIVTTRCHANDWSSWTSRLRFQWRGDHWYDDDFFFLFFSFFSDQNIRKTKLIFFFKFSLLSLSSPLCSPLSLSLSLSLSYSHNPWRSTILSWSVESTITNWITIRWSTSGWYTERRNSIGDRHLDARGDDLVELHLFIRPYLTCTQSV